MNMTIVMKLGKIDMKIGVMGAISVYNENAIINADTGEVYTSPESPRTKLRMRR